MVGTGVDVEVEIFLRVGASVCVGLIGMSGAGVLYAQRRRLFLMCGLVSAWIGFFLSLFFVRVTFGPDVSFQTTPEASRLPILYMS